MVKSVLVVLCVILYPVYCETKTAAQYEDIFCTNYTLDFMKFEQSIRLNISLGNMFWEAAGFFKVSGVSFVPVLYSASDHHTELNHVPCKRNNTVCKMQYLFSNLSIDIAESYDLEFFVIVFLKSFILSLPKCPFDNTLSIKIYISCTNKVIYICEDTCEVFEIKGLTFKKPDAIPTYLTTVLTEGSRGNDIDHWLIAFSVIIVAVIMITIFVLIRKRKLCIHNGDIERKSSKSVYFCQSPVLHRPCILLIGSSECISEEITTFLKIIRENYRMNIVFHEENILDVAHNENDWIDKQFYDMDHVVIVLHENLFKNNLLCDLRKKLLDRLCEEVYRGGIRYSGICFHKQKAILTAISKMHIRYPSLLMRRVYTLVDIEHSATNNQIKHELSSLIDNIYAYGDNGNYL